MQAPTPTIRAAQRSKAGSICPLIESTIYHKPCGQCGILGIKNFLRFCWQRWAKQSSSSGRFNRSPSGQGGRQRKGISEPARIELKGRGTRCAESNNGKHGDVENVISVPPPPSPLCALPAAAPVACRASLSLKLSCSEPGECRVLPLLGPFLALAAIPPLLLCPGAAFSSRRVASSGKIKGPARDAFSTIPVTCRMTFSVLQASGATSLSSRTD
jgi:hypothetical protein